MNITVYLGANPGNRDCYARYAYELGRWIGLHGHTLVYGGSRTGLMGKLADGALEAKGRVIGVEPRFFVERELQHEGISELIVTETMGQRKEKMLELGEVFLAFPGGVGTLEEISEVMSREKMGLLSKPFAFLDFEGYYQPLKVLLKTMADEGFVWKEWADKVPFLPDVQAIEKFILDTRPKQ
ncbi:MULTISPECIES: TIGR00730 family Rossman fold protein [Acidaminococcus]|uniref:LOG family protein n=1 Tax=Acidaminococcus TaxID=904 RepID=UPI002665DB2D|nr:TIGR00730 family Rossman fold protein [Acidaminococcus sp.]MDO5598122.1 TIGR00730 family Rossman fold protein [Acidaminococcus sp.]